jgi:signal transduction histidine kinase
LPAGAQGRRRTTEKAQSRGAARPAWASEKRADARSGGAPGEETEMPRETGAAAFGRMILLHFRALRITLAICRREGDERVDKAYLPYLVTEAFCIAYTITIFSRLQSEVGSERELVCLKKIILAFVMMAATDMLWIFVENSALRRWHLLNAAVNGVCVSMVAMGCFFWFQFVELRLNPDWRPDAGRRWLLRAPMIAICALDLLSIGTGWVFYIGADGAYREGGLFWLQGTVTFAYLLLPTAQVVWRMARTSSWERRREYLSYIVYICVCIAAVLVGDSLPTVPLFTLSIFAAIQFLFLTLYLDCERALAKKEREQTEANAAVMLSQLQPHFLFNALMAIQDMCHGRAPEAEEAVVEFAEYLRGNLDSLRRMEPIPFAQELNHTKNYLALEEKRFAGKIHVEYDIRAERFSLPALTLQPIVENAVRYGVTQRVEGGTIRISTEERDGAYLVTVQDDGVGFEPGNTRPDGRNHIGVKSVRSRLADLCQGSLAVKSRPGEGTTVVMRIPKGRTGMK